MIQSFALNFLLLMFSLSILTRIYRYTCRHGLTNRSRVVIGICCGLVGVALLYSGYYDNGFLFDVRSVALLVAIYFGGWISGTVTFLIALIPRAFVDIYTTYKVIIIGLIIFSVALFILRVARAYWSKWLLLAFSNGGILGVYASINVDAPIHEVMLPYAAANAGAALLAGLFLDTERRLSESERLRTEALQANEAKVQFIARISHELRNPLNGIMGLVQLLQKTPLSDRQANYTDKIMQSAAIMLHSVNEILDLSKLEIGRVTLTPAPIELRKWISEVEYAARTLIQYKPVQVSAYVGENCPSHIIADELRLNQIMMNLISNAVKFTERGTITVEVELKHQTAGKTVLSFLVKDTGIGMTEEHLVNIMRPFSQAEPSISKKYGGTGLGLVICKELLALMDSRLMINSSYGEGSEFRFTAEFSVPDHN